MSVIISRMSFRISTESENNVFLFFLRINKKINDRLYIIYVGCFIENMRIFENISNSWPLNKRFESLYLNVSIKRYNVDDIEE